MRKVPAIVSLVLVLASCSGGADQALQWTRCGKAECATLTVPLDHDDPSLGTIDLAVARRTATNRAERIGVLLYNPGGPGVPGTPVIVDGAEYYFSSTLLERFDVVSWDPRGATEGTEVVCVDDPDFFVGIDPTPDTPDETADREARLVEFVAGCVERSGDLLPYLSTVSTARDMDLLRAALGEDQISYFGQSYGAWLGAVYATLFPDRVRAVALDGGVTNRPEMMIQQAAATEQALTTVLDECAANRWCRFNNDGDPYRAFDELMLRLDNEPLMVDGRPLGEREALTAVGNSLRWDGLWQFLVKALANAQEGDGAKLLELAGSTQPLAFGSSLAIICLTSFYRGGLGFPSEIVEQVMAVAPRMGSMIPPDFVPQFEACGIWPVGPDLPPPVTATGAAPILVVGTTGDIATPFAAGRDLTEQLEQGVLLIVEANRHTAYQANSFEASCITETVDRYLTDLNPPANQSMCKYGHTQLYPPNQENS